MNFDVTGDDHPFEIPTGISIWEAADRLAQLHFEPHKAKQVWRNTVAVLAVHYYLELHTFHSWLESSYSFDPAVRSIEDVADLVVPISWNDYRLECRPAEVGQTSLELPMEVLDDRIAYIWVELDLEQWVARLIGIATPPVEVLEREALLPVGCLFSEVFPSIVGTQED